MNEGTEPKLKTGKIFLCIGLLCPLLGSLIVSLGLVLIFGRVIPDVIYSDYPADYTPSMVEEIWGGFLLGFIIVGLPCAIIAFIISRILYEIKGLIRYRQLLIACACGGYAPFIFFMLLFMLGAPFKNYGNLLFWGLSYGSFAAFISVLSLTLIWPFLLRDLSRPDHAFDG